MPPRRTTSATETTAADRSRAATNAETILPDLERTFIVMAGADAAFDILSDPVRVPDYVSIVRLEDSTAIDGEADVDAGLADRDGAPGVAFVADRKTRRITWGDPGGDYGGSITVSVGTTNTSRVTLELHTRDDADDAAVDRVFERAISDIRTVAAGR
jgi:hypothetical protein